MLFHLLNHLKKQIKKTSLSNIFFLITRKFECKTCKLWFCCCFVAFFIKLENSSWFCAKACFSAGITLKLTTCTFQNEGLDSDLCRFLIQENKSRWVVSARSGRWFSQGSFGFCHLYKAVFNPQAHEQMIWLFQEIHLKEIQLAVFSGDL